MLKACVSSKPFILFFLKIKPFNGTFCWRLKSWEDSETWGPWPSWDLSRSQLLKKSISFLMDLEWIPEFLQWPAGPLCSNLSYFSELIITVAWWSSYMLKSLPPQGLWNPSFSSRTSLDTWVVHSITPFKSVKMSPYWREPPLSPFINSISFFPIDLNDLSLSILIGLLSVFPLGCKFLEDTDFVLLWLWSQCLKDSRNLKMCVVQIKEWMNINERVFWMLWYIHLYSVSCGSERRD